MSIARRLRRLARAHLRDLREELWAGTDSSVDAFDREDGPTASASDSAPSTDSTRSAGSSPGVPPAVAKAYRALEVPVGSDRRTVKKGYRRVMKKYHQDRFDEDPERRAVAGEVSKRLNQAYETVTDYLDEPERR